MLILVVNCGSSSAKYDVFNVDKECSVCKGMVSRIGEATASFSHEVMEKDILVKKKVICGDHHSAVEIIRQNLVDPEMGVIKDVREITGVGHRVVHGGEEFSSSTLIDNRVIRSIEKFSVLAPLHNPPALEGIRGCMKIFQNVPQVAVFDTAFHQTMPEQAYLYGIPYSLYEKYKVRRYGFHGSSHRFVSRRAAEILGKPYESLRIISCHLGNGASICAIRDGKSVDTSMGMTPLEGLVMGTRCGDIDAGAVLYIADKEETSIPFTNTLLNKHSGILGLSGVSSDMRDVEHAASEGNHRAKMALDIYHYHIRKYIGSYAAAMGGVDVVILTGGVGENGWETREEVCKGLEFMGLEFSAERNAKLRGKEAIISADGSKVTAMVVPTNEELVIATDTFEIVTAG